ncbi:hypothetical protein IFR05_012439 [Cadophora sp. M221]|nr:hypothetical protein IFR05_012439 [Cadophora sp. M221]
MSPTRCACKKVSTKKCSTCKYADYCSRRCEGNDLASHKLLYNSIVEFKVASPRPSNKCFLALYFQILLLHTKGRAPEFIWFDGKNKVTKDEATGAIEYAVCLANHTNANPKAKGIDIFFNYVNKSELGHTIVRHIRHAFRFDGSRMNLSLLETTKGNLGRPWGGPLVVYSRHGLNVEASGVNRDITLSDFRTFLDFCTAYGSDSSGPGEMLKENMMFGLETTNPDLFSSILRKNSGGTACKGVEVPCDGDTWILGLRNCRVVDVPVNHPI